MVWGGLSAPQPTRGSRERRELPQCGVRGGAPAAIAFSAYLGHRTLLHGSKKDTILHFEKVVVTVSSTTVKSGMVTSHHRHIQSCAYAMYQM